jgi:taurine transport system substrate-binding protein
MSHFGVDVSTMDVVDMAPAEGAAAFAQGELDMVCGWGGGLQRMLEHGNVLLTGAEKEELGILVFDVTSTPASFVAENPDLVSKFLKVTADANAQWASGGPADMLQVIAKDAGMAEDATDAFLKTASFPTIEEQLSGKWLGGAVQEFLLGVAQVFFDAGGVESILSTYDNAVNSGPLAAAASM